jgi:hypothetical protein
VIRGALIHGVSWAGLLAGPLAWALNFQIGYLLVPDVCAEHVFGIIFVSLSGILIALAGACLSWRAWTRLKATDGPNLAEPYRFLAGLGASAGALFAFAILLQAIANLMFQGCER